MLLASAKTMAKMVMDRKADLKFVVGSGETTWDNFNPPKFPDAKETLYNESYRGAITSIKYVDPTTFNDAPANTVTNALKIVGVVPSTSSVDGTYIREKAIFVLGDTKNSGNMLHAESTSLETKTAGKEFETTMIIIIR